MLFQVEQINKMTTLFIQNGRLFSTRTTLNENSCHFLNLLSSRDLYQAEKKNTFVEDWKTLSNSKCLMTGTFEVTKMQQQKKKSQLEINHVIQQSTEES